MIDENNIDIDGGEFHKQKLISGIELANIQLEKTTDAYEREQILARLESFETELNELNESIGSKTM